jgi:hypothetical protein
VLVLPPDPHDLITRPASLPERQTPSSQSGGVEGKNPGGVRVLLANPRWERRFVKFLELSGVGRVIADGTDEDGTHAARMDEWNGRQWREQPLGERDNLTFLLFLFLCFLLLGARTPRLAHSAPPRAEDLFCLSIPTEGRMLVPLFVLYVFSLRYISLRHGGSRDIYK